jgi:hypothetical protein
LEDVNAIVEVAFGKWLGLVLTLARL